MEQYYTTFASVIYYAIMAILAILLLWWSARKVASVSKTYRVRMAGEQELQEGPAIRTALLLIVFWVLYAGAAIALWNVKQAITSEPAEYQNPFEKEELKNIQEFEPATDEELIQKKKDLEQSRDKDRHDEAIASFEEKMRLEAEKIRRRNDPNQRQ